MEDGRKQKTKEAIKKWKKTYNEGLKSGRIEGPNKGKSMSEEQKDKLRESSFFVTMNEKQKKKIIKKRTATLLLRGHKRSDEQKENLKLGMVEEFISREDYKCIVKISITGEFLDSYVTPTIASSVGLKKEKQAGNIKNAIKNGTNCGGFKWRLGTKIESNECIKKFRKDNL